MFITTVFSSYCYANNGGEILAIDINDVNKSDIYISAQMDYKNKTLRLVPLDSIITDPNNPQIKYIWDININKDKSLEYDTEKIFEKINCLERKITMLSFATYLKGKMLNFSTEPLDIYCPPNSIGEEYIKIACKANKEEIINSYKETALFVFSKDQNVFLKQAQYIIEFMLKGYNKNK